MKRIRNIAENLPGLEKVAARASALEQLARLTREAVPEPMQPHVIACAVRDRTLVVFTDTAAWGSQLRFIQPMILDAIHHHTGHLLDTVRLKVQQPSAERPATAAASTSPTRESRDISQRSRAVIESAAEGISDPDLAAALQRLARGRDQDA